MVKWKSDSRPHTSPRPRLRTAEFEYHWMRNGDGYACRQRRPLTLQKNEDTWCVVLVNYPSRGDSELDTASRVIEEQWRRWRNARSLTPMATSTCSTWNATRTASGLTRTTATPTMSGIPTTVGCSPAETLFISPLSRGFLSPYSLGASILQAVFPIH